MRTSVPSSPKVCPSSPSYRPRVRMGGRARVSTENHHWTERAGCGTVFHSYCTSGARTSIPCSQHSCVVHVGLRYDSISSHIPKWLLCSALRRNSDCCCTPGRDATRSLLSISQAICGWGDCRERTPKLMKSVHDNLGKNRSYRTVPFPYRAAALFCLLT